MRKYPKGMEPFVSLAMRSKSSEEAYNVAKTIKGVSPDVAKWFGDTFGKSIDGRVDINVAFDRFYKEVHSGKYTMEGEVQRFKEQVKKIIKEELLMEAIEDYISAFREFDPYYTMSDDRAAYKKGEQQDRSVKGIYDSLRDSEKRQAAIWYRDYYMEHGIWKGTAMNSAVSRWNPETDFEPDSFDGVNYRG